MIWTDERIAELSDLWASGHSCGQIGRIMEITRSAVIGKVHRLELPSPEFKLPVITAVGARRPSETPKTRVRVRRTNNTNSSSVVIEKVEEACDLPPDQSDCAVALVDLELHHCRWPLGDGMFCGAGKMSGRSYCARHCRMAYAKSPNRITDEERARRAAHARRLTKSYKLNYLNDIEGAA